MARVPTTIEVVLAAVKARVLAYCPTSFPGSSCVWLTLGSDEDVLNNPPHDRFVTVRPIGFPPDQGVVTGAGAALFESGSAGGTSGLVPLNIVLAVDLWVRLLVDEQGADDSLLTDALGILPLWAKVLGALQMYDPTASGSFLLSEPMRLVAPGGVPKPRRKRTDYAKLESTFEAKFVCQLPATGG